MVRPWSLPDFGGDRPMSVADLQALQQAAYDEGLELGRKAGHDEGLRRGTEDARRRAEPLLRELRSVLAALAQPLEALDDEIEQALAGLAMAVARQLVRRELRVDPGQVVATVRQAVSALPSSQRTVHVRLHPEDRALVREALAVDGESGWKLIADPVVERGGCVVETEVSRVDATIESRLNAVIAQVLGGDRSGDGAEASADARDPSAESTES